MTYRAATWQDDIPVSSKGHRLDPDDRLVPDTGSIGLAKCELPSCNARSVRQPDAINCCAAMLKESKWASQQTQAVAPQIDDDASVASELPMQIFYLSGDPSWNDVTG